MHLSTAFLACIVASIVSRILEIYDHSLMWFRESYQWLLLLSLERDAKEFQNSDEQISVQAHQIINTNIKYPS